MNQSHDQRTTLAGERPRKTVSFADRHTAQQVEWKQRTSTLPEGARAAGTYRGSERLYPVCLPVEYAAHNILPDVRDRALALFASLDISWHDSVAGGPSNHLRDSQVQCVNALLPMTTDPVRIKRAFGHVVDIAEVLPIEDDRLLTFEYIGPVDYFGEGSRHGVELGRRRGAHCTSVDAAFRYRATSGVTELALVEWKYTESYLRHQRRDPSSDAVRIARYGADLAALDSPVATDDRCIELLLDEPFYQLARQQLLAHRLEVDPDVDADVVRVIHVLDPGNDAYQTSLVRPEHRALGATVDQVWAKLLRTPDRFVHVDPSFFLDPKVTSPQYVGRYQLPDANALPVHTA